MSAVTGGTLDCADAWPTAKQATTNRTERSLSMEPPGTFLFFAGRRVLPLLKNVKLPRMKIALFAVFALAAAPVLSQPVNPAADAKPADPGEWHSLFNGRDLSGWTI